MGCLVGRVPPKKRDIQPSREILFAVRERESGSLEKTPARNRMGWTSHVIGRGRTSGGEGVTRIRAGDGSFSEPVRSLQATRSGGACRSPGICRSGPGVHPDLGEGLSKPDEFCRAQCVLECWAVDGKGGGRPRYRACLEAGGSSGLPAVLVAGCRRVPGYDRGAASPEPMDHRHPLVRLRGGGMGGAGIRQQGNGVCQT